MESPRRHLGGGGPPRGALWPSNAQRRNLDTPLSLSHSVATGTCRTLLQNPNSRDVKIKHKTIDPMGEWSCSSEVIPATRISTKLKDRSSCERSVFRGDQIVLPTSRRFPSSVSHLPLMFLIASCIASQSVMTVAASSLDCDFERTCFWQLENGFVLSGKDNGTFFQRNGIDPPKADGSRNETGHYALTRGENLRLHLSNIPPVTNEHCTLFFDVYRLNYSNERISVFLSERQHSKEMYSVTVDMIKEEMWQTAKMPLNRQLYSFNLTIELHPVAVRGHHQGLQAFQPSTANHLNMSGGTLAHRRVKPRAPPSRGSYIAVDNIRLKDCLREIVESCGFRQHHCSQTSGNDTVCVPASRLCDLTPDCPAGDDENLSVCGQIPESARCSFDEGSLCNWTVNAAGSDSAAGFELRENYVPSHLNSSSKVWLGRARYLCSRRRRAPNNPLQPISLVSPLYPRPPFYHSNNSSAFYQSCHFRFYYLRPKRLGSAGAYIEIKEEDPRYPDGRLMEVWPRKDDKMVTDNWTGVQMALPTMLRYPFRILLHVQHLRPTSDAQMCFGLDDFSLSSECFGLGVPANETRDFPAHLMHDDPDSERTQPGNISLKYEFDTCGAIGRLGPADDMCRRRYYAPLSKLVRVSKVFKGVQIWQVPETAVYTIFAVGASGGQGLRSSGRNEGAYVRASFRLRKGEKIYILVGQKGTSACDDPPRVYQETCVRNSGKQRRRRWSNITTSIDEPLERLQYRRSMLGDPTRAHRLPLTRLGRDEQSRIAGSGGGGGGATYVFREEAQPAAGTQVRPSGAGQGLGFTPLIVAAGGGGLAVEETDQDPKESVGDIFYENGVFESSGSSVPPTAPGTAEASDPERRAGTGGGWSGREGSTASVDGRALLDGATGGLPCKRYEQWRTFGGFGGGGGGCLGGGGGGGWRGGDAGIGTSDSKGRNGGGGGSFVLKREAIDRTTVYSGLQHPAYLKYYRNNKNKGDEASGSGFVVVVSSLHVACPCKELCIPVWLATRAASPEQPSLNPRFRCACYDHPARVVSRSDNVSCVPAGSAAASGDPSLLSELQLSTRHLFILLLCALVTGVVIVFLAIVGFVRCPLRKSGPISERDSQLLRNRRDHSSLAAELQLSRLRQQTGMVTEYNPNYEFGGSTCTLHDLPEIPRESLTLVKALGQGAFGEVYEGVLTRFVGDTLTELSVAVKTLPELSAADSEKDFITEACIMSKFQHPNIVSFIGVCFDRMPRFIVLELLAGGDLKSFLRESRPKPGRLGTLSMEDLLLLAVDVARGCQYLEEKHFIHRDIAARNCLLTSRAPEERQVKIADFGMARDIYRADYYRKGGKAMLPVKWMPPEAFLDGMFTSKTDVWSFGVLLWEVMSMGYMPYPGRGNQEVMQLVTGGGRLEPPINCPGPVYHIMTQCWHPQPEERPAFGTILERLGYCLQDPDVISTALPMFQRAPSIERPDTGYPSHGLGRGEQRGRGVKDLPSSGSASTINQQTPGSENAPLLASPPPAAIESCSPASPLDDYMVPMGQFGQYGSGAQADTPSRVVPLSPISTTIGAPLSPTSIGSQLSPTIPAPPPPRPHNNNNNNNHSTPPTLDGTPLHHNPYPQQQQQQQDDQRAQADPELPILEPLSQHKNAKKKSYANVGLDNRRTGGNRMSNGNGQPPPDGGTSFNEISC